VLPGALVAGLLLLITLERDSIDCHAYKSMGLSIMLIKKKPSDTTYLFLEVGLFLLSPLATEPDVAPECVTVLLIIHHETKQSITS
jgi:hypothetical protein